MIAENIKYLEEKIAEKCRVCGRDRKEIKLIAVSKTQPIEAINEAFEAGITEFGENRAQELRDKYEILGEKVNWHFIGHLQANKIKYVIKSASYIHSVDSVQLASNIDLKAKQIGKVQNVLLEIKTSDEPAKFGLQSEDDILAAASFCQQSSNLNLVGLMTMAPFTDDARLIRQSFKKLRELKDKMNRLGFALSELSMGMTGDYEIAIEEGATMLRIGTAIFGERNY